MLHIVVIGMGPIGVSIARAIRAERAMRIAGLVDIDPNKVGQSLDELEAMPEAMTADAVVGGDRDVPRVVATLDEALAKHPADLAVVTTSSAFDAIAPTLRACLAHRLAVISTCEQMVWPWYRHADLARQMDREAQEAGVALLGTGVNPGFVMDLLAVVAASMLRRVTAVRCVRRVEASVRRVPLQAKIGATLRPETFAARAREGRMGHAGLPESLALLAAGIGRQVEPGSIEESLEPVLAPTAIRCGLGLINPGNVAGVHHVARWQGDDVKIELDLTMAVEVENPKDTIAIEGPVRLFLKIPGGLPGDSATVAAVLNNLPHLPQAKPGLRTMLDLPPAGCHNRDV